MILKGVSRMNKIAICIPTCNRADKIHVVLEKESDFLYRNGVDLHIFDSSETAETKEVADKYKYYKNLYYHLVDNYMNSNAKVFNIYQKYARKYEYIWIMHDHTILTEDALCHLLKQLDKKISYYFLEIQSQTFGWEDVTDLKQLLYKTAWLSGRYGTVLLKSNPFLYDVDWEYFNSKYMTEKMWNYSHIGFYFERASQLINFKARVVKFPRDLFSDISNSQKIGWYQDVVRICLECWGEVISNLPEIYTNKQEVMQTQDEWFLSKYSLITYKKNGVYDFLKYWKYKKWFKKIAPDEKKNAFFISLFPVSISQSLFTGKLFTEIKRKRRKQWKICIYGAGRHGIECMDYLESCGIGIDAFLVTKKEGNPEKIREYSVYRAEDYVKDKRVFIVIAIMSDKINEIKLNLDSLGKNGCIQYTEFM